MAQFVFKLSDLGEGLAEAEVVALHVGPGAKVERDQPLLDVVTAKATIELTAPVAGVITAVEVDVGEMAPVGSTLMLIETGADIGAVAQAAPVEPPPRSMPARPTPRRAAPVTRSGRAAAAPAVRARAEALGIDLARIRGTGPEGRVTHQDLDRTLAQPQSRFEPPAADEPVEAVRLIGVRRQIAEHMETAKRRIPHFGYVEEIDLTELEALRTRLNADAGERPRLTQLAFLLRALAHTLPAHPQLNARYDDEAGVLHRYRAIHAGVAAQTPDGLLVPVVRNVERLDLWACAAEIARLAVAARERRLPREALSGSTITVTSLGRLGGVASAPIINWPEVAILSPGQARERPAVQEGRVVGRVLMNLSGAFDHRVVDGYEAAQFVQEFKAVLESPETLA